MSLFILGSAKRSLVQNTVRQKRNGKKEKRKEKKGWMREKSEGEILEFEPNDFSID